MDMFAISCEQNVRDIQIFANQIRDIFRNILLSYLIRVTDSQKINKFYIKLTEEGGKQTLRVIPVLIIYIKSNFFQYLSRFDS